MMCRWVRGRVGDKCRRQGVGAEESLAAGRTRAEGTVEVVGLIAVGGWSGELLRGREGGPLTGQPAGRAGGLRLWRSREKRGLAEGDGERR